MEKEKITLKQIIAILSAGLFSFSGVVIETATNITFPTLMSEFHVSTSTVQWMTTGNLLMMGIFIPISSYLKKRFQTKHLFLVAGLLFTMGLLIDIFASSFLILLVGRLIQGIGVGIALPMMYNIILDESPKHLIGVMMGCGAFVTAAAPAIGPTFGGIMTQYLNWRFIFIGILPLIFLAIVLGAICIRENKVDKNVKLDVFGFIAIGLSFVLWMMGFSSLDKILETPILVVLYFVGGILSLIYFVYREIRIDAPLIQFSIFKEKGFIFHLLAVILLQMSTLGLGLLLPIYIQIVLEKSAGQAGVALLPGAVIGAVFAPVGGLILDRFGAKKPIVLGTGCSLLAVSLYILWFHALTYTMCTTFYFIYSLGIGLVVGNTMTCALSHLSKELQADGNATLQTLVQLSGGIGTSISAAMIAFSQKGQPLYEGTKYGCLYVFLLLGCVVVLVLINQMIAFKGGKKNGI